MPEISIIVRTRNEERWIAHCLAMVYKQDYRDFEVILVDNQSTDHTVTVASRYPLVGVVTIDKYLPGHALNEGIRASTGKYIVCLSAHCIPKNVDWLSTLRRNFGDDERVAGVYGRQLPVSFSNVVDKRDLLIVFGQDRRVQIKDYFFHNANSMLRRDVWDRYPFDEQVTNIEDRVWGKEVIEADYRIVYDPEAAVYHHHGLHQGNAPERAKGVVSIIERVDEGLVNELPESLRPEYANIAAVVPVQGDMKAGTLDDRLLTETIAALKQAKYVDAIYLVAGDIVLAERLGVSGIDRGGLNGVDTMSLDELMCEVLRIIESRNDLPEALLYVNYDYPFRPVGIFDDLILDAQYKGYDTVFPGLVDFGHYWFHNGGGEFRQTDPSMKSRDQRQPIYRALYGLGCVSSAWVIRAGKMVGGKIGILPIDESRNALRLRELGSADIYEALIDHRSREEAERYEQI
ncbi:MAG TPA: glycosyltransferase family 2 protein [Nitrospirales bacterium]|nr:glycosyltransferase family 2 protein [Nitrospirales bacterium]